MPTPRHIRWTFSGVFGSAASPVEEWSWTINTMPGLGADATPPSMLAAGIAYRDRYVTHIKPIMPSSTIMTRARAALVGDDGLVARTDAGEFIQGDWTGAEAGAGAAPAILPLQTALVASLVTRRAGATGKGRVFLPFPAMSLGSDYRLTAPNALSVANAVKGLVNSMATIAGSTNPDLRAVVASSKGYLTPVSGIRVGVVPDTQRSRRDRIPEAYQAVSL